MEGDWVAAFFFDRSPTTTLRRATEKHFASQRQYLVVVQLVYEPTSLTRFRRFGLGMDSILLFCFCIFSCA
jgi:hypothetical protein